MSGSRNKAKSPWYSAQARVPRSPLVDGLAVLVLINPGRLSLHGAGCSVPVSGSVPSLVTRSSPRKHLTEPGLSSTGTSFGKQASTTSPDSLGRNLLLLDKAPPATLNPNVVNSRYLRKLARILLDERPRPATGRCLFCGNDESQCSESAASCRRIVSLVWG
jgi:hypothetical protein